MALALLIYVVVNLTHVAGHLLAARLLRIRVHRLSLGIGPTLRQWSWNGTIVRITPLPVGVLVRLRRRWSKGEGPPEAEPGSFRAAGIRQLGVICAPLALLLLLGWCAAFYLHGVGVAVWGSARVGVVQPGGPAQAAGVRPGDVVLKIDGEAVDGWVDLQRMVSSSKEGSLRLVVRRGKARLQLEVEPRQVAGGRRIIGVQAGAELQRVEGLASRARAATATVGEMLGALLSGTWRIIAGGPPETVNVGGPVGYVRLIKQENETVRASSRARLIALSIINYLFICLLPLPFLDGRRLLFWALGALRPLHPRWEQGYNRWGFAVVGVLLLLATAKDVLRSC